MFCFPSLCFIPRLSKFPLRSCLLALSLVLLCVPLLLLVCVSSTPMSCSPVSCFIITVAWKPRSVGAANQSPQWRRGNAGAGTDSWRSSPEAPSGYQTARAALQSLQREQTQDQQVWRPLGEAEQGQQVERPELMTEQVTKLMIEQGTEVAVVVVVEVVVVVVLLSLQKTREMAGRAHMSLQRRQERVQTSAGHSRSNPRSR